MRKGIFTPSRSILDQRITTLQNLYLQASRQDQTNATNHSEYASLLEKLQEAQTTLRHMGEGYAVRWVSRQPAPVIESIVRPAKDTSFEYALLGRLSWSPAIREYNDTKSFTSIFQAAPEEDQLSMLENVAADLLFSHQQNNDVNLFLYQNYQQMCQDHGFVFDVVE